MEIRPRKRLRSDENSFVLQSKIHVDQKIIDLTDCMRMRQVYDKTMHLLFKGSKINNNYKLTKGEIFSSVILNGTGKVKLLNNNGIFKELKKSLCCDKPALVLSHCSNCNLNLCEHCGFSCIGSCGATMCSTCITLFECGTFDEPICGRCKYMI